MRIFYLILGLLFVALGLIGIFIPIWPTTPFILLSVFFFSKSNKDFNEYILNNKYFGNYIRNYYEHRSMKRSSKVKTILFLWVGLIIAMVVNRTQLVIVILMIIGVLVSLHIVLLKERTTHKK